MANEIRVQKMHSIGNQSPAKNKKGSSPEKNKDGKQQLKWLQKTVNCLVRTHKYIEFRSILMKIID